MLRPSEGGGIDCKMQRAAELGHACGQRSHLGLGRGGALAFVFVLLGLDGHRVLLGLLVLLIFSLFLFWCSQHTVLR